MKMIRFNLWLVICWAFGGSVAFGADPALPTSCELKQGVNGTFSAGMATYWIFGTCRIGTSSTHWSAQVVYENQRFTEILQVENGGNPVGRVFSTSRMPCADDPWLSQVTCEVEIKQTQQLPGGDIALWKEAHFYSRVHQNKPFSATFNYDRGPLLAKRAADLKAEAKRLGRIKPPAPLITMFAPTIVAPAANARFFSNTSVPIKIAPPQGIAVTMYMVKIEHKDSKGIWTSPATIPVGPAEASSPSGYLGWGTGGSGGRSVAFMALPGTYRVSAQVSSPRETGWSQPVEFVVTTPNKAIQKAPKLFGP